jgi:hypothetical protein
VIAPSAPKVLVIAESSVYTNLQTEIQRYTNWLISRGYNVELYQSSSGTAEDLKAFILGNKTDLIGCVFIGSIPAAWYEVENDYNQYGYAQFPCDLFLMDLDGAWDDLDTNGIYDTHTHGTGDQSPEIFIGRIDASQMGGDTVQELRDFFDKDNEYWNGNMTLLKYGLTYTEDDWAGYYDFRHDISYLYGSSYEAIAAPATNRDDYLNNRLKAIMYEFIQLSCHSYSGGHYFTRGGYLYSADVRNAPPQALGFNLFCCSALRFTDPNFLGGAYVFNDGPKALTVVGSTKTGSMLGFSSFYDVLGDNRPFGTALKEWFEAEAPYDIWDVYWHYGMTIIGDPMICFLEDQGAADMHITRGSRNISDGQTINVGDVHLFQIIGREIAFTVHNEGWQTLELTGTPDMVTLSGPEAKYFMVLEQPLLSSIPSGGSTTFKIKTKRDTVPGVPSGWSKPVSFTIIIPNNDPDEDPYDFTIEFTAIK